MLWKNNEDDNKCSFEVIFLSQLTNTPRQVYFLGWDFLKDLYDIHPISPRTQHHVAHHGPTNHCGVGQSMNEHDSLKLQRRNRLFWKMGTVFGILFINNFNSLYLWSSQAISYLPYSGMQSFSQALSFPFVNQEKLPLAHCISFQYVAFVPSTGLLVPDPLQQHIPSQPISPTQLLTVPSTGWDESCLPVFANIFFLHILRDDSRKNFSFKQIMVLILN